MPRAELPVAALVAVLAAILAGAAAGVTDAAAGTQRDWIWPVDDFRWERAYEAPAHRYGAGHRGVDLRPLGGDVVRAPADGTVAFSGMVADRAVVTIDHGGGLVTTLEPVESPLEPGDAVAQGDVVGTLSLGGHVTPGALHFGVRADGEYINPLLLLGGIPRAVLLPCC